MTARGGRRRRRESTAARSHRGGQAGGHPLQSMPQAQQPDAGETFLTSPAPISRRHAAVPRIWVPCSILLSTTLTPVPCFALCVAPSKVVEVSLVAISPRLRRCWAGRGQGRERNVARRLPTRRPGSQESSRQHPDSSTKCTLLPDVRALISS